MLEAFNIWGGSAYAELEPVQQKERMDIDVTQLAIGFSALLAALIIAKVVSRIGRGA